MADKSHNSNHGHASNSGSASTASEINQAAQATLTALNQFSSNLSAINSSMPANGLGRAFDRLGQRATAGGWLEQDVARYVQQLVNRASVAQKYGAFERLGLDRGSSTRDVATALLRGSQTVWQQRNEEAHQRAEKQQSRMEHERERSEAKADRDRQRQEREQDRIRLGQQRVAFEAQPWVQEMRREQTLVQHRIQDQFAPGRVDFRERQHANTQLAVSLGQVGMPGIAGTMGRVGGFAQGLETLGFQKAAGLAQRAALPLAIASQVANTAETVANLAYDRYSTSAQLERRAFREIVPGGERIQRFFDAMTGRSAGFEQADINARYRMADVQSRLELAQFNIGYGTRQGAAYGLLAGYRGQSAVIPGYADRSTALGERAYRDQLRLLPLKQAEAKAERDATAATHSRVAAQKELRTIAGQITEIEKKEQAAKKQLNEHDQNAKHEWLVAGLGGVGGMVLMSSLSGVGRQELLKNLETIQTEKEGLLRFQTNAKENATQKQQEEVQARNEVLKARVRTQKLGRAEMLESHADQWAGTARAVGGMSPWDQAFNAQSAIAAKKYFEKHGTFEGLPTEFLQAGLSVAGNTLGTLVEQAGAKGTAAKILKEAGGFEADYGDINVARKEAQELRREYGQKEFAIDMSTAGQIAEIGQDLGQFMVEQMKKLADNAKDAVLRTILLGRNSS